MRAAMRTPPMIPASILFICRRTSCGGRGRPVLLPGAHQDDDPKAGLLSGGEQQMVALGCKLIADPKVLMMER